MPTERDIKEEIRKRIGGQKDELQGYTVFLFGSRVTGNAGSRSDFDVGIWGEKPINPAVFYRIGEELEGIETLLKIDWVDFNRVNADFRHMAMRRVEILYGS